MTAKTTAERQQARRQRLNEIAQASGYQSWTKYETETIERGYLIMNENEIDQIFGNMATDEVKIYMGKNWTVKDVRDYLRETGYKGNADEIMKWLKDFANNNA